MEQQELFPLTPIAEKQIFSNYEVHDKKRLPIILSLIGISVILHSVILAGVVLTPGIRDLFYLSALFNDARNSKTVSKDYDKTEIGDNYTVTMVDPNSLYQYPEGYFSTLDPNDPNVAAMTDKYTDTNSPVDLGGFNPTNPTIVPTPNTYNPISPSGIKSIPPPRSYSPKGKSKGSVLPPLPTGKSAYDPIPNSVAGEEDKNKNGIPDKYETNPNVEAKNGVKDKSNKGDKPKPEDKEKVTPKTEDTAQSDTPEMKNLTPDEVNKKPLIDYGNKVNLLIKDNKVDLNQPFNVTIEGELDKNGKLVNPKATNGGGDEMMRKLAGELIAALNDGNVLSFFQQVVKDSKKNPKFKIVVEQNQSEFVGKIVIEVGDEVLANRRASSLNTLKGLSKITRGGKDEEIILEKAEIKAEGKNIVINCSVPRELAMQLIQKQLENVAKEKISEAESKTADSTAAKK